MRFRKRPIVVDAFQMTRERRWDISEWPDWVKHAWFVGPQEGGLWVDETTPIRNDQFAAGLMCGTLEGICRVQWNDWIIRGIKGEIYPCKPDIFDETYDPIPDEETSDTPFEVALQHVLNSHTPDWILARFIRGCLDVWMEATRDLHQNPVNSSPGACCVKAPGNSTTPPLT